MNKLSRIAHSIALITSFIILMITACTNEDESGSVESSITITTNEVEDVWIHAYFTDPESADARSYRGGLDELLAEAIDKARLSVDVAIYNMNLWSVRDALIEANARGVVVRIVTDSSNMDGEEFQDLMDVGIPILGDRRESLMHNKFVIIDRQEVWTGSMNFTLSGVYEDNNNLIQISSLEIAENYMIEFNEMYVEDQFGNESPKNTPHPSLTVDEVKIETYFSPEDGVSERLVDLIEGAEESIYFMAYSFTSDALGEAIRRRAEKGLTVAGIMDEDQALTNEGTEYYGFLQGALDVKLDGNEGLMHHKVTIIDARIIITGSYNFSRNADESNDENVLIIHDPRLASLFIEEFWRLYNLVTSP